MGSWCFWDFQPSLLIVPLSLAAWTYPISNGILKPSWNILLFTHCQWAFSFLSFVTLSSRAVTYCLLPLGVGVEVLAMGREPQPLWGEARSAPCEKHLVPVSSCWTHCWTQGWGTLGKTYLERSKCCWGVSVKVWETVLRTPGRMGEEMLQLLEQRFPCSSWRHRGGAGGSLQPAERNIPEWISTTANYGVLCQNRYPHCNTWRIPCQRRWQVLKEAAGHGGAQDGALKNCAEEGASEMNWLKFMGWPQAPFPILSSPCRGRKEWEWRNEFEPGKKSEG